MSTSPPQAEPETEKPRPPRFGRGTERPRAIHAREAAERADALLEDIDTLIATTT